MQVSAASAKLSARRDYALSAEQEAIRAEKDRQARNLAVYENNIRFIELALKPPETSSYRDDSTYQDSDALAARVSNDMMLVAGLLENQLRKYKKKQAKKQDKMREKREKRAKKKKKLAKKNEVLCREALQKCTENLKKVKNEGEYKKVTIEEIESPTLFKLTNWWGRLVAGSSQVQPPMTSSWDSNGRLTLYHGTNVLNAAKIERDGFIVSTSGMLGPGVYCSRQIKKALAYGSEVLELSVDVGNVCRIDRQGHPLQYAWHQAGYNSAWVPPNCGMVPSGLEEDCIWDPSNIVVVRRVVSAEESTPDSSGGDSSDSDSSDSD